MSAVVHIALLMAEAEDTAEGSDMAVCGARHALLKSASQSSTGLWVLLYKAVITPAMAASRCLQHQNDV